MGLGLGFPNQLARRPLAGGGVAGPGGGEARRVGARGGGGRLGVAPQCTREQHIQRGQSAAAAVAQHLEDCSTGADARRRPPRRQAGCVCVSTSTPRRGGGEGPRRRPSCCADHWRRERSPMMAAHRCASACRARRSLRCAQWTPSCRWRGVATARWLSGRCTDRLAAAAAGQAAAATRRRCCGGVAGTSTAPRPSR